jgi:SAM-dependent methyltransferase
LVFKLRFFYFVRVRRNVRSELEGSHVMAMQYSVQMLLKGRTSHRPLHLIRPLSVIDHIDKATARVLSIGCRFETELLYLVAHGFRRDRVRGLDMISYSPWVDVGNMHNLPYDDNSWDVVILGWVLPYSDDQQRAAAEVVRVCRNGGIVAIGLSYYPPGSVDNPAGGDARVVSRRLQTVDSLLGLFGTKVGRVLFRHDPPDPNAEGTCAVLFELSKTQPGEPVTDA